jgi:tetratricopeptide (TPR) repeat protein/predicted Ser/Thr protein kinase
MEGDAHMIGRSIGRFRILSQLGKGGMASVWRVRDELLGHDLALKILEETLAQVPDSRRRFRHEATIAAKLDHPGIAAVYDSGENDGQTWIAMAVIEGRTLSERLIQSLPPVREVVDMGVAVADALGYAHDQGVVHRDVTSRNVMLADDGRVFVLDFGLAIAADISRISSSGTTVGTAHYMAPEVLLGGPADARSDVYGLGAVLYEALTGAVPFASDRPAATAFAALNRDPPPIRALRPEVSPELESIVLRCLARDPASRFARAAELAEKLRAVRAEAETSAGLPDAGTQARPRPAAMEAPAPRSTIAARLTDRTGPIYLAVPRFSTLDHDEASDVRHGELARGLTAAVSAGLARLQRVHVVPSEGSPVERTQEGLREYARSLGAQLLLLGSVRKSGTRLRVTVALLDPEASVQIAGDTLEGSLFDVFELEDRLLASLRGMVARKTDALAEKRERPRDPAAAEHFQQALRYMERHDSEASVDAAIALLERLIESEGETAEVQAALARALLFKYELTRQHMWEVRARTSASRAAELAPDAAETLLALADVHRELGRLEEALAEYERALAQRPGYFEARLGRARALDAVGRGTEAEAALHEAIAQCPEDWRGYSSLGRLYFSRGEYARAVGAWHRVLELAPDSARGARNLGSAFYRLDRFEDAIRAYQSSLSLQPNALAFTNLGTVLFSQRRLDEAASAFERAAALTPADPVMWGNLGNALRAMPGREDDTRRALERAVGLMRDRLAREAGDREDWGRLAGWLSSLGETVAALDALGIALERSPGDVHTMVRAAHVHLMAGNPEECLRWLKTAVENGYGSEELRRDPEFEAIRETTEFRKLIGS